MSSPASTQNSGFDRKKFIEMREQYMNDAVRPLEETAEEAWKAWHEQLKDEL